MRRALVPIVFAFVLVGCGESAPEDAVSAAGTAVDADTDATVAPELPPLSSVPVESYTANHIPPPASFATAPSTGGDHYAFWQNCGFYTVPVIEGAATHTLEHGAVWITYNPDAVTSTDLEVLSALAAGNNKLLISPYDHDDTVVLSAWGVQQRGGAAPSTSAGATQINNFIAAWVDNPELPEAGVTCLNAVGTPPDDVRSFADGEQVPDEYE